LKNFHEIQSHGLKIAIHKRDVDMVINADMSFPVAKGFFSGLIRKQTLAQLEKSIYTAFTPDIVIEKIKLKITPIYNLYHYPGIPSVLLV